MSETTSSHRAWRCHAFGDYHDLVVEQRAATAPGSGEILVRNRAFAVGFPDMLMVQGLYQYKPPLPFTPCAEFAGDVLAVGADVTGFKPGDRVMGTIRAGAAAERVVTAASDCMQLPDCYDYAHGAAFIIGYKTAYVGLVVRGGLKAGETVLVHGAAGGVGLAAVELANAMGARVIGMAAGTAKLNLVSSRGAAAVIDYAAGPFRQAVKAWTDGRGADVVFDPIGGDVFDESLHCIAPFGRMLVIGFASGRIPTATVNHALLKQYAIIGVRAGEYGRVDPAGGRAVHAALEQWAASGKLLPHVHQRLPFEQLLAAFDTIAARRVMGRVVCELP
jgi:NADPH2:quinone reductase